MNTFLAVALVAGESMISLPKDPGPVAAYAATEIRDYVEKSTGVRWSIVTNAPAARGVRFAFVEDAKLGEEGFRLNEKDGVVTITASPKRGVLYGAYDYLERFVGVRWYSADTERVPKRAAVEVPKGFALESVPDFRMRNAFWYDVNNNATFAARLRNNANAPFEAKHGGLPYRFGKGVWACHTFGSTLLPNTEFFDKHPEYYGMRDGKRDRNNQPCLTNPDVLRIVTERIKDIVRKDPGARFYGVSQDDHQNYCECPSCAAVDAEEGSHAGCIVRFVNAVAEEVEKEFPGVIIETLAYQYSRFPTKKTKFRHNVVPCVCTIECGFGPDPIEAGTTDLNAKFVECLKGWGRQTDEIYLWDYVTNFRNFHHFFPNLNVLQANLRFFHDNKVRYMFEQGDHVGRAFMSALQAYVQSKWMWDLDLPAEELVRDFTDGYYGAGGVYVRQFLKDLDAYFRDYCRKHPGFSALIYETMEERVYDEAFVRRAEELWAKAEAAAKDDPIALRNVRAGLVSVAWERFHLTPNEKTSARLDKLATEANARRWSEGLPLTRLFETRLSNYLPGAQERRRPGWDLIWCDEFDKPELDCSRHGAWKFEHGFVRNKELQYYTVNRPENCRIENGCLVLETRKEKYVDPKTGAKADYTSASLVTDQLGNFNSGFHFMYGRVEVRAKVPAGKGVWPAAWTLGAGKHTQQWPWCGEIDIMEFVGHHPNRAWGTAHWSDKSVKTANGHKKSGGYADFEKPLSDDFHVYAIEWDETSIKFEIDGKVYHEIATDKLDPNVREWPPFNQYHFLILNLAYGGAWGGEQGVDDACLPAKYLVDYVRVYERPKGSDFRIRDPFILADSGKYYLFESHFKNNGFDDSERGVFMRESTNLRNWSEPKMVMLLPKELDCSAVWAPEVHKYNGAYWMFVTLTQGTNARGTWVFKASSPWDRFHPVKEGPIPPRERMTLDGTLYVEDGKPYMVFCHEWCQTGNGTIEYAPLKADLTGFTAEPRVLLDAKSAMKGAGNVTDGPFFWRSEKSGKLYMIWSNFLEGKGYAVFIRQSESGKIAGPWTKDRVLYDGNGGHAMIFRDFDGKLHLALHQPNDGPKERLRLFELIDDGEELTLVR